MTAVTDPGAPRLREVRIAEGIVLGQPGLVLIAGPCVIESASHASQIAREVAAIARKAGVPYVFKASFDKANRARPDAPRGPGLEEGLRRLARVRDETGLPVLTDVHEPAQAEAAAKVADVLQVPAFLSRQTDLVTAVAGTGKPVNVKKGQFMAPDDMGQVVEKCRAAGNEKVLLCERGASFGYHDLVVDMRSFPILREFGCPVIYDVTHSLQLPGGGKETGGLKQYAPILARAAAATGCVDGFFLEVHDQPEKALSDRSTQLDVKGLAGLIVELLAIKKLVER